MVCLAEEREHSTLLDCVASRASSRSVASRAAAHVPLPRITMSKSATSKAKVHFANDGLPPARNTSGQPGARYMRATQASQTLKTKYFQGLWRVSCPNFGPVFAPQSMGWNRALGPKNSGARPGGDIRKQHASPTHIYRCGTGGGFRPGRAAVFAKIFREFNRVMRRDRRRAGARLPANGQVPASPRAARSLRSGQRRRRSETGASGRFGPC